MIMAALYIASYTCKSDFSLPTKAPHIYIGFLWLPHSVLTMCPPVLDSGGVCAYSYSISSYILN